MRYGIPTPTPFRRCLWNRTNFNAYFERARGLIAQKKPLGPPVPRCFYYGAITGQDLFLATSVFRGSAYRAGDATRRQRR